MELHITFDPNFTQAILTIAEELINANKRMERQEAQSAPAVAIAGAEIRPTEEVKPSVNTEPPREDKLAKGEVSPTYTLEQIRAGMTDLPTATNRNIVRGFGVAKLTQIPVESYPELWAQIQAAKEAN